MAKFEVQLEESVISESRAIEPTEEPVSGPGRSRSRKVGSTVALALGALAIVGAGLAVAADVSEPFTLGEGPLLFEAADFTSCAHVSEGDDGFIAGITIENPTDQSARIENITLLESDNLRVLEAVLLPIDRDALLDSYPPTFLADRWPDKVALGTDAAVIAGHESARMYLAMGLVNDDISGGFSSSLGLEYEVAGRQNRALSKNYAIGGDRSDECTWSTEIP